MSAHPSRRGRLAGRPLPPFRRTGLLLAALGVLGSGAARGDDESIVFTPPGFERPGLAATASGPSSARLEIVVLDGPGGQPTPCRLNVVGADGQFYQTA